jgi:hypothetical protein
MKIRFFDNRGRFMPELSCGKPMWTTTNGQKTHYEREYSCWFTSHSFGDRSEVHITPSIFVDFWNKGGLSSISDLGTITHSCGIGIRFWNWYGTFTFMRALNTKTSEEINKGLLGNGVNKVL